MLIFQHFFYVFLRTDLIIQTFFRITVLVKPKTIYETMVIFTHFDSLTSLFKYFRTNKTCIRFLEKQRWTNGVVCPYCGFKCTCHRGNGRWQCNHCHSAFSVLVGTIFENTKLPLAKWFAAMYLVSAHCNGISSVQLSKDIQVSQKTAWFMLQKIRTLYKQSDYIQLSGNVECDEMYLGGRETNKHKSRRLSGTQGRSTKTKAPIFGMVQYDYEYTRQGKKRVDTFVRAMQVEDTKAETLLPIINQYVKPGSTITTDELSSYFNVGRNGLYAHRVIKHKDEEYVVGEITTNRIEGFWGGFKRMVFATYHFVSRGYLQRYIDEACFRYNTRKMKIGERFVVLLSNSVGKCSYEQVKVVNKIA